MRAISYKMRFGTKHLTPPQFCVLMNLVFHSNVRNRAWPSIRTISKETGLGTTSVSNAIQRLIELKAIEKVAYDKRVGKEAELYQSKNIYQLTGVFVVGDEVFEYFHMDEAVQDRINFTRGKNLPDKNLRGVDKVYTDNISTSNEEEEVNTSTSAPLGAGEATPKTKRKRKPSEHSKRIEVLVRQLVSDDALEYDDLTDAQLAQYGRFANKLWGRELKELHLEGDITPADLAAFVTARDGLALPLADGLLGRRYAEWLAKGKEVRRGDNGEALEPVKQYEAVTDEDGNTYMREVKQSWEQTQ